MFSIIFFPLFPCVLLRVTNAKSLTSRDCIHNIFNFATYLNTTNKSSHTKYKTTL